MRKHDLSEGDLVRFLNDKLEGRIIRILPGERALVEIEDGFPMDAAFSELVKVSSAPSAVPVSKPNETGARPLLPSSPFPLDPGVHLLLVPYPGQVSSGPWQMQLHNTYNTSVLYSMFLDKPLIRATGNDLGVLGPGEMVVLGDATDEHTSTESCEIAIMLHDRSLPDSHRFHLKRLRPSAPGLQSRFPTLQSPCSFATTTCVYQATLPEQPVTLHPDEVLRIQESMNGAGRKPSNGPEETLQHNHRPELIIDLHIESIASGKVPKDVTQHLELQLKHFKRVLDRAILDRYPSVCFIHGVGNGTLRKAIREELDTLGFRYADGPAERFGQGATRVTL